MGVSENSGTPKWMVYNGNPYESGWFGGTIILGHISISPKFWLKDLDLKRPTMPRFVVLWWWKLHPMGSQSVKKHPTKTNPKLIFTLQVLRSIKTYSLEKPTTWANFSNFYTWIKEIFGGISLQNHLLGWPTGRKGRYNLLRIIHSHGSP